MLLIIDGLENNKLFENVDVVEDEANLDNIKALPLPNLGVNLNNDPNIGSEVPFC